MPRRKTDFIVVHCAATSPSMDIGLKEIDRWHRARGFLKVGYHFIIRRDGALEEGRQLHEPGVHTPKDTTTAPLVSAWSVVLKKQIRKHPKIISPPHNGQH